MMNASFTNFNRSAFRLTTLSVLLLWPVAGCGPRSELPRDAELSKAASVTLDRVTVGTPVRKTLRLVTRQPGRVEAYEQAPILSKISGYIESVGFDLGDRVQKGEQLLKIHAPEYAGQLEQKRGLLGQARAQVKQAEAELVAALASANSTEAMVTQAEAGIGRAEADYARWESESKRIQELASKGSVTVKLAEEAASQLLSAQAARQEALAAVTSAKAKQQEAVAHAQTAEAEVATAKAKLRVAEAEIQQAETMLAYTTLQSPFDGYVTSRKVDTGHYVQPAGATNSEPLLTISNVSKVRVFVNVPESEAHWVDAGFNDPAQGDPVKVMVGSAAGQSIASRVTRTSLQLDPQSRTLSTEIDLDNTDLTLLPGSFVTAEILLEERSEVLTLPTSAIVKLAGEDVCCTVVNGKIVHRPITLGLRVGDEVEISSGLAGTETVVLLRASALQLGQTVEMIKMK